MVTAATAPGRLSLAGGGTDIPAYAARFGGAVVGLAIDRRVCVLAAPVCGAPSPSPCTDPTAGRIRPISVITNAFAREAIRLHRPGRPVRLVSTGDLPVGIGLGSSGAFCVSLLAALGVSRDPATLAAEAAFLEIQRTGRPVGVQDQYLSALGGIRLLRIDGMRVSSEPLPVSPAVLGQLARELLLFSDGRRHDAGAVLSRQVGAVRAARPATLQALHRIKALVPDMVSALLSGDLASVGALIGQHWAIKRSLDPTIVPEWVGRLEVRLRTAGATGLKISGAGGVGTVLVHCPTWHQPAVRATMRQDGFVEIPYRVAERGVVIADLAAGTTLVGLTVSDRVAWNWTPCNTPPARYCLPSCD